MADLRLNVPERGTALTRVAEQGWLTGQIQVMQSHSNVQHGNRNNALPLLTTADAFAVNQYEVLCVTRCPAAIHTSNRGKYGHILGNEAFSTFNGKCANQDFQPIGISITAWRPGCGLKNPIVSFTMSGTITIDATHNFNMFDLMQAHAPVRIDGGQDRTDYPYHPQDDSQGRLRCILKPVVTRSSEETFQLFKKVISIYKKMNNESQQESYNFAEIGSIIIKHGKKLIKSPKVQSIFEKEQRAFTKSFFDDYDNIKPDDFLSKHLMKSFSTIMKNMKKHGKNYKGYLISFATNSYFLCTSMLRKLYKEDKITLNESTKIEADLVLRLIDMVRVIADIDNIDTHKIVGMALNTSTGQKQAGLDLWIGNTSH